MFQENYEKFARTRAIPKDIAFISPAVGQEEEEKIKPSQKRPLPPVVHHSKNPTMEGAKKIIKKSDNKLSNPGSHVNTRPSSVLKPIIKEMNVARSRHRSANRDILKSSKIVVNQRNESEKLESLPQKQLIISNQVPPFSKNKSLHSNDVEEALSISEKKSC